MRGCIPPNLPPILSPFEPLPKFLPRDGIFSPLASDNVARRDSDGLTWGYDRIGIPEATTSLSAPLTPALVSASTNASYMTHGYGDGPMMSRSKMLARSSSPRTGATVASIGSL